MNMIAKNAAAKCKEMDMKWNNGHAPTPSNVAEFRQYFKTMASNSFPFNPSWAYEVLEKAETAGSVEELAGELTYPQFECAANLVLTNMVNKKRDKLYQEVTRLRDEYERFKKGRVNCLQILWLIYDNCKYKVRGETVYNIDTLMNLKLGTRNPRECTVNMLRDFLYEWDKTLSRITTSIQDDVIYTCFNRQVSGIGFLHYDMKNFDRLPEVDKTYERLYQICRFNIEEWDTKQNQREMFNLDTGRSRSASPAVMNDGMVAMPAMRGRSTSSQRRKKTTTRTYRSRSSSRSHHRLRTRSLPRNANSVRRRFRTKSRGNRDLCMEYMTTRKCKYVNANGFCKRSHHPIRRKAGSRPRYPSPSRWKTLSRSPSIRTQTLMSAAASICFQFQRNGSCSYGKNCKFAHSQDDPKHKENGSKGAAPAENVTAAAPGTTSTPSKTQGATSSTGGTGSPTKEKPTHSERRADSPAAVDGGF